MNTHTATPAAPAAPPTFEQFAAAAQFGRYPGARRLFVLYGSTAYTVDEQRRGRLTADPATVLRRIFDAYGVGKRCTFFATLDRDLRALDASRAPAA